jgi:hypothetical protein
MLIEIKVLIILWKTWHVAQKILNKKTYKFWSIINEKIQSKNEFCPISIGILQLDNNTSKETKGLFLPPYLVPFFIVPIDIHTIKQNVYVEILIYNGVMACFVDETLLDNNTFTYYEIQALLVK